MKRFLVLLGSIFAVFVAAFAIFVGYVAYMGPKLDASSKAFVDNTIPEIVSAWSTDKLLQHASPRFRMATSESQVKGLLERLSAKLGPMVSYGGSKGDSNISITPQAGRVISARYLVHATFQQGPADITVVLLQDQTSAWSIAGFNVNSTALLK